MVIVGWHFLRLRSQLVAHQRDPWHFHQRRGHGTPLQERSREVVPPGALPSKWRFKHDIAKQYGLAPVGLLL